MEYRPARKNLSRLQRSFTVIIEGGIGLFEETVPYPAECAASRKDYANSGGITDILGSP